jgi:hypothetical protein
VTALIVLNAIAAAAVVAGLAVTARLGYLTAGGRFDRSARHLELHRDVAPGRPAEEERRAA